MNKLIELKNLTKNFDDQQVLRGINLDIYEKEFLTLLGPSGCGKTTTLRIIAGFEEPSDGEVLFNGIEISKLPPYKREVNTVFQKYALFPHLNVAENSGLGLNLKKVDKTVIAQKVERMLKMVGLEGFGKRDVTLLSGGQQQRVGIARALAVKPEFIVCDEPISALDVSIQSQVVNMLEDMQEEMGLTYLFIAHDLSVVRHISNRIGVMYLGSMVELGESYELNRHPIHPYTQTLLSAVPVPDPQLSRTRKRIVLEGDIPSPMNPPSGCRFHTRCPYATEKCSQVAPEFKEHEPGHWAACHLLDK